MWNVRLPKDVSIALSTAPARWIETVLSRARWATVAALLPDGFEAYARVLHPAHRRSGELVRWAEVASFNGRIAHPLMQFECIAQLDDMNAKPDWGDRPRRGRLSDEVALALLQLLRAATATPEACWFCVWVGYGGLREQLRPSSLVRTPHREYVLLRGPLDAATTLAANLRSEGPNIWWPEDRAWCVATEVDLDSTYIAGSSRLIEDAMRSRTLDVVPADLKDRVDLGADTINR